MSKRKIKTLYEREQEELMKLKANNTKIHRGDIYFFDKGPVVGVEQQGGRPGVIVSNDACNNSSEFLLVCYLTTQPKTNLPTHVPIMCEQKSICLCEQVHTLSKQKMQEYYCTATPEEMAEIDKALVLTLGIDLNNLVPENYVKKIKELEDKQFIYQTQIANLEVDNERLNEEIEKIINTNYKLEEERKLLNKDLEKSTEEKIELEDYYIKELNKKDKEVETFNKIIFEKTNIIKKLEDEKYKSNIQITKIQNTPEYIRVCTERDIYKELYKELLNKKMGD